MIHSLKNKIERFLDLECYHPNDKNFDQERFELKRDIKILRYKLKNGYSRN
jgi:hypothetical protein